MLEIIKLDQDNHKIVIGYIRTTLFKDVTLSEYLFDTELGTYVNGDDRTLTGDMLTLITGTRQSSPAHGGYINTFRMCMSDWLEGKEPPLHLTLCLVPYTKRRVPKGCHVAIRDGIITSVEVTYN